MTILVLPLLTNLLRGVTLFERVCMSSEILTGSAVKFTYCVYRFNFVYISGGEELEEGGWCGVQMSARANWTHKLDTQMAQSGAKKC